MHGDHALRAHAEALAAALLHDGPILVDALCALFGPSLRDLDTASLHAAWRALRFRCPPFMRSDAGVAAGTLLAYAEWVRREGGAREHLHPALIDDLQRAVADARAVDLPLHVRVAFGLLSSAHTRRFVAALRARRPDARALLALSYDRAAIERWLGADEGVHPELEFRVADLNGMCMTEPGASAWVLDEPVALSVCGVDLRMRVSNEAELSQLARPERSTTAWLARTVGPASVVLDAGANIGLYSALAGRLGARAVVTCEPVPDNHARLVQNLRLNGVAAGHAFPVALGASTGVASFGVAYGGAGSWSHPGVGGASDRTIACVTYTLDDLVAAVGLAPTHLKIDVDGDETAILRAARATLADPALRHVLIEVTAATLPAIRAILEPAGFGLQGAPIETFGNCVFERAAQR